MRLRHYPTVVAVALLVAGCGSSESQQPALEVAVRVNGEPVAIADVAKQSARTASTARQRIDAAVVRHLAAAEATRRGLSPGDDTEHASIRDEENLRDALFASMRDSLALGEDELRAHYEKTRVHYVTPQVSLRRRSFASETEARAEDLRLGAAGRIASEGSDRIGPAPVDRLPEGVMPEALTLTAPGQRVVLAREGRWWLVEQEEMHAAEQLPFEAVRPRVEQSLRMLRAQSLFHAEIDRLRREAEVAVDESALERMAPASNAPKPTQGGAR
jgi:hypothetical protein